MKDKMKQWIRGLWSKALTHLAFSNNYIRQAMGTKTDLRKQITMPLWMYNISQSTVL